MSGIHVTQNETEHIFEFKHDGFITIPNQFKFSRLSTMMGVFSRFEGTDGWIFIYPTETTVMYFKSETHLLFNVSIKTGGIWEAQYLNEETPFAAGEEISIDLSRMKK